MKGKYLYEVVDYRGNVYLFWGDYPEEVIQKAQERGISVKEIYVKRRRTETEKSGSGSMRRLYELYAKVVNLPTENIAFADYDMLTKTFTFVYGIGLPRYKQKAVRRKAPKDFADFFKAPIFVGLSAEDIVERYLRERSRSS
jgi:hypothetical protein